MGEVIVAECLRLVYSRCIPLSISLKSTTEECELNGAITVSTTIEVRLSRAWDKESEARARDIVELHMVEVSVREGECFIVCLFMAAIHSELR